MEERNNRNSKNSLRYKYIATFIAISVIPLMIISLYVFRVLFKQLDQEIEKREESVIHTISNIVDDEITNLLQLSSSIVLEDNFSQYYLKKSIISRMKASESLKNYVIANGIVEDIIFFVDDWQYALSTSNSYSTIQDNWNSVYNYLDIDQREFYNYISIEKIGFKSSGGKIFVFINKPVGSSSGVSLIYIIRKEILSRLISSESYSSNIIIGKDNEILLNTNSELIKDEEIIDMISGDNNKFYISTRKSKHLGIKYYCFTNNKLLKSSVNKIRLISSVVFGVLFMIIIVFVGYISNHMFVPIQKIVNRLSISGVRKIDEVDKILEETIRNDEILEKEIHVYKQRIIRNIATDVLNGNITKEEYVRMLKQIGINRHYSLFTIGCLYWGGNKFDKKNNNRIIKEITSKINNVDGYLSLGVSIYEDIFIIINSDKENSEFLNSIIKLVEDEGISLREYTLLVENSFLKFGEINKQFLNILNFGSKLSEDTDKYVQLIPNISKLSYLKKWNNENFYQVFELDIQSKNIETIKMHVIKILDSMFDNNSILFFEYIPYDMINSIIKVCTKYNIGKEIISMDYVDILDLVQKKDIYLLKESIMNLIKIIESDDFFLEEKDEIIKKVLCYIDKNYGDSNMTLENIADELSYSYKYLSRKFKKATGYNISEYITRVRIRKFKEFLDLDLEIDKAIKKVGYNNIKSFERRFVQFESITVAQYCSLKKDQNS